MVILNENIVIMIVVVIVVILTTWQLDNKSLNDEIFKQQKYDKHHIKSIINSVFQFPPLSEEWRLKVPSF